jgi:ribonuclease HII
VIEEELRKEGFFKIAGVDEAGRGPLAGPVYAAACIIPEGLRFQGINDSKKLTAYERELLYDAIISHPDVLYAIAFADEKIIDKINILRATFFAIREALTKLSGSFDLALIDGSYLPKPFPWPARTVVKGDALVQSISAASILAKVSRDRFMKTQAEKYPGYGFENHFGYATPEHYEAIEKLGPCELHRKSFAPFKSKEDLCLQLSLFQPS